MNDLKKKVYVFLFNGFSDWEISYLTPELNRSDKFELIYFTADGNTVTSIGGLQVKPAASLDKLKFEDIDFVILPGGTAWEKGEIVGIDMLLRNVFDRGKIIAAICGATTYLAQLGLLNNLKHTSNDLNYLKAIAPDYSGSDNYQSLLAVSDENIITASGIAPVDFAREVFKKVELKPDDEIEKWFQLFKNGIWIG